MDSDISGSHGAAAVFGAIGVLVAKELVGRFFGRSSELESEKQKRHDQLIERVLEEVQGLHVTIATAVTRLDGHVAAYGDTKRTVESHEERISSLEVGHAELRARVERQ